MDLDLNNLDLNEAGSWPLPARLTLVFILFLLVAGLGYWFDIKEQTRQLTAVESQEQELKDIYNVKAHKAANLVAYREQLEEMRQSFGAMLRQLPNKTEVADLLVDISQTGLASGLEFELFQPAAEVPQDFYAELPISIRVRGSYHEFGEFVSGVAALPRIVTLNDIEIEPAPEDKQGEEHNDGRLVMSLTAKTYRYLEEQETASDGGAQ